MKRWQGDKAPWKLDRDMYSSYGLLSDPCVPTTSTTLQRSTSFCGIKDPQSMPGMTNIVHCLSTYMNLIDIEACLETNVHANLHSLHGGAWDCAFDLQALVDTDPHMYPQTLMNYISVYQFNPWYKYAR